MTRRIICSLLALLAAGLLAPAARADVPVAQDVPVNTRIKGRVVDYTGNHGTNRRIWSRTLYKWRDTYVYLPPNYDRNECYPVVVFLHGFFQDEQSFLGYVPALDEAICKGKMPPTIVIAPDGSLDGEACFGKPGSFFLNSNAGWYEDYVLQDVWDYVVARYPVRPEREAHALVGVSMGGFAAYNLGLRHRNCFGVVAGINPPLNLRWADCDLNARANFDPRRWGWRLEYNDPREVVACFGTNPVRMAQLIEPVFGLGDDALVTISENNPLELALKTRYCNGDLAMFVAYGGRDEFNVDAQVESFLYTAKFKGWGVTVAYDPNGRHDYHCDHHHNSGFTPALLDWLGQQLGPFAPGACCDAACAPRPTAPHYLP